MSGFFTPKEVTEIVVENSKKKSELPLLPLFLLGTLAGAYIAFGAELANIVTHDMAKYLGMGFAKFMAGSVFSVGLVLVVIGGGELFTGNCLIFTGILARSCTMKGMLRNWFWVYVSNFVGSFIIVGIIYYGGLWKLGANEVGIAAVKTAACKTNLSFTEALCRGIGCNWLVCLGVWLALAGKDSTSKIIGIYFPVMAFVASGFEHSVANMYFIPIGLFLKNNILLSSAVAHIPAIETLTWTGFLNNLIPVTLGNIIGGSFFVGSIYFYSYIKKNSIR